MDAFLSNTNDLIFDQLVQYATPGNEASQPLSLSAYNSARQDEPVANESPQLGLASLLSGAPPASIPVVKDSGLDQQARASTGAISQRLRRADPDYTQDEQAKWQQLWANKPMPPPPPKTYPSREDLMDNVKCWGREHGYQIVVKHSRKNNKGLDRIWFQCELGGTYRNQHKLRPELRKRNRFSRKTDCPLELLGLTRYGSTEWTLEIRHGEHNHGPIRDRAPPETPTSYPDLEDKLFEWHQQALRESDEVHGIALKNKALALFESMEQYRDMTPNFDRAWLHAYRIRYGLAKPQDRRRFLPPHVRLNGTPAGPTGRPPPFQDIRSVFHNPEIFDTTQRYVETYMSRYDLSHDYQHILRVFALAKQILTQELGRYPGLQLDRQAIYLAALLHDVGDQKYLLPGENGENQASTVLLHCGTTADLALKVQTMVSNVSYSKEIRQPAIVQALIRQIPELAIVQDADRLDAIGAVGIARCFAYGGAKEPTRGLAGCVAHFREKLERVEGMMKTVTGREMARVRTERLKEFRRWWDEEAAVVSAA